MKLREDVVKYQVRYHGTQFEEPDELICKICPECQSANIREPIEEDDTAADWVCEDCGCKFDQWTASERTKAGEIISRILIAIICTLLCLCVVSMIGGVVLLDHYKTEYNDVLPDYLSGKCLFISLGIPAICGLIIFILSKIDDKI